MTVHLGDCVDWLDTLEASSVDAVVCDPPYGLSPDGRARTWDDIEAGRAGGGFMGQAWDAACPGTTWARAVLRVLKPGGHLVAFGATRTVHRLACALEDAGFECRDTVHWCYWSGFPKDHDVSKAIDRAAGQPGVTHYTGADHRNQVYGSGLGGGETTAPYEPATPEARRWQGWGTALKPAVEPAVLARKPLGATVAANVLQHGTGALHIDACRFAPRAPEWPGPNQGAPERHGRAQGAGRGWFDQQPQSRGQTPGQRLGRWPANLVHVAKPSRAERERGTDGLPTRTGAEAVGRAEGSAGLNSPRAGAGHSARDVRNFHPTVKPVRLMRWLVRLVTPPGGLVLDPFVGSGSRSR